MSPLEDQALPGSREGSKINPWHLPLLRPRNRLDPREDLRLHRLDRLGRSPPAAPPPLPGHARAMKTKQRQRRLRADRRHRHVGVERHAFHRLGRRPQQRRLEPGIPLLQRRLPFHRKVGAQPPLPINTGMPDPGPLARHAHIARRRQPVEERVLDLVAPLNLGPHHLRPPPRPPPHRPRRAPSGPRRFSTCHDHPAPKIREQAISYLSTK